MNKKEGLWEKMMNTGYCIITGGEHDKVTFPFVNEDYYIGKVHCKKTDYTITLVNGTYYTVEKGKVVD